MTETHMLEALEAAMSDYRKAYRSPNEPMIVKLPDWCFPVLKKELSLLCTCGGEITDQEVVRWFNDRNARFEVVQ